MSKSYCLLLNPAALLLSFFVGSAQASHAQSPIEPAAAARRNIVSVSPVELFYKTQLGYERGVGPHSSVGLLGSYHYGNLAGYQGWQTTGYYRHFFTRQFPTGLYLQLQASVCSYWQDANLINQKTSKPYSLRYRGLSGGGGLGLGYRGYFLRRATGGRLLWNALLGLRGQARPVATYDETIYRPEVGFLGISDDANWYLGPSPGSLAHGLLTLDYQF
ncbi:hypothetical protein ACFST9_25425 [Hymenobacter monticola]|uniref:DUF3575 domain-containing protein n=1 Tax=Hymenobacter monticola TaxID=1705399 RepID=A0ABY4B6A1_9BACT|nr:hypothetical protein [Hymenobacter monticola]UOE34685.1 hypothetical protein MTP16_03310 [Hymenobacter monticola]